MLRKVPPFRVGERSLLGGVYFLLDGVVVIEVVSFILYFLLHLTYCFKGISEPFEMVCLNTKSNKKVKTGSFC